MFSKVRKAMEKAPKKSRAQKDYEKMVEENKKEAIVVANEFQKRLNALGYDLSPKMNLMAENVAVAQLVLTSIQFEKWEELSRGGSSKGAIQEAGGASEQKDDQGEVPEASDASDEAQEPEEASEEAAS